MISLPLCRWRADPRADHCLCRSPKFVAAPNRVPLSFCTGCGYVDHEPARVELPVLPCVHLGGALGRSVHGEGEVRFGLFNCHLHRAAVPAWDQPVPPRQGRACVGCGDYRQRDPFGPDSGQMRVRADAFLRTLPDYPRRRFRGRGVVLVGGGERYFPSLYIAIRALRHVGCILPIQVWYLGRDDELPANRRALLAPLGVTCIDADDVRRQWPARRLNGWELKVYAALHSPFRQVLFLDADCYPCRNPDSLFDHEDFLRTGAVFWPDLESRDDRLHWSAFGVEEPGTPGSVESGQFLIDKKKCWRPFNLTWFYNDHSDYYHRYCHGDKHTFQVAWARCDAPLTMWRHVAEWRDIAYIQCDEAGDPLFVHRCAGKFTFKSERFTTPQHEPGQAFWPRLPLESECWGWLGELTSAVERLERPLGASLPERIVRIGLAGHFNASLLEHEGRFLLASRDGTVGAKICLSELGRDFQPRWTRTLAIDHPGGSSGVEDPRLFLYRGQLHCAFSGIDDRGPERWIHQMICRLDRRLEVERVWIPEYSGRAPFEKNWQFFEHEGELYSVYSIRPHVVLRHRRGKASQAASTDAQLPLGDMHLRGGAPPVRVGKEYYHFYHTMKEMHGQFQYGLGVYTFEARPPFPIRRFLPRMLMAPSEYDRPTGYNKVVVFPCGAILRGDKWIVSYGQHDAECRVALFRSDVIERQLERVGRS